MALRERCLQKSLHEFVWERLVASRSRILSTKKMICWSFANEHLWTNERFEQCVSKLHEENDYLTGYIFSIYFILTIQKVFQSNRLPVPKGQNYNAQLFVLSRRADHHSGYWRRTWKDERHAMRKVFDVCCLASYMLFVYSFFTYSTLII